MSGAVEKRCACPEARWPKCAHPWYLAKIRVGGQEYAPNVTRYAREVLAPPRDLTTKTEAEAVAAHVVAAIRAGTYVSAKAHRRVVAAAPPPAPEAGQPLEAIVARFGALCIDADPAKRRRSKVNDKGLLARLCAHVGERGRLGARPMAAITIDELVAFRGAQQAWANSTWNKCRTVLGQLWAWARWSGHLEEDLFKTTPPAQLKRLARQKAAQRAVRVSPALCHDILEAARETRTAGAASRLYAVLLAAVETSARIGELLALRWRDVNLEARQFLIRAEEVGGAKTGRARTVDISGPLAVALLALRKDPAGYDLPGSAYVFGTPYGDRVKSIAKAWNTAVLRAHRIEPGWTAKGDFDRATRARLREINLHVHDLRHEAGSRMLESQRFDLVQIQQRLGHSNVAQTSTYLHAAAGSLAEAQARYDADRAAAGVVYPPPPPRQVGTKRVSSGDKLGTNATAAAGGGRGFRMVKGGKSRVG